MTFSARIVPLVMALAGALVLAPSSPEVGNILFLAASGVCLLIMWPHALPSLHRPIVWMTILGLALLGAAYVIASGELRGLEGLLFFIPLIAVWPLAAVGQAEKHGDWLLPLSTLALCGTAGAAIVAIGDVVLTGTNRAGESVANPIHFADVVLLVGFFSAIGLFHGKGLWRLIFLLGPFLALIAVLLSGTRGAVVAAAAMIGAALLLAAAVRLISLRVLLIIVGLAVAFGAVALLAGAAEISGISRVMTDLADIGANGLPQDASTFHRMQMYVGGFRAFLESPIFGHGPFEFSAAAGRLADDPFGAIPHLHSDLADFAASGGAMGLIAFALFLLAPLAELHGMPKGKKKAALIVLVGTLLSGFVVMGLTNAMFGILTITCSYVAICASVALLRDSPSAI